MTSRDPETRHPLRLPSRTRLRRHSEFQSVMRRGTRLADGRLSLWIRPNDLGFCRLGLVVGRKHGNAVRRNRIRRLIRDAFRQSRNGLPGGWDIAVAPQRGAPLSLDACMTSLDALVHRAAKRASSRRTSQ